MPSISIDRSTVSYSDLGNGPVVMLLHGFPLDRRVFADVADRLRTRCRVILPDLPGFGQSETAQPFTIGSLADDVATIVRRLDLKSVILGGLSMGGYVAQALAQAHPALLAGLVLIDTKHTADDLAGKAKRDAMIELVKAKGTPAVVDQMLPMMLHQHAYKHRPEQVEKLRSIMLDCPARTIEYACGAMRDRRDFTETLKALELPVKVIVGEDDRISPPSQMRETAALARRGSISIVADAGHLAPFESPEIVADEIARFVFQVQEESQ